MADGNTSHRFERLPANADERAVEGRATRAAVLDYWEERFGVPRDVLAPYTFWEKGAGKIWIAASDVPDGLAVESLGMTFLRTRQEHWKPTTNAAQRFGRHATRNVIDLTREAAEAFVAGEDQDLAWDGDWGYLIAAHDVAAGAAETRGTTGEASDEGSARREPLGVGLYLHGELRSMIPKGRRREF
ncbi:NOL1/NOP2/fmu family ribosome biogenesis protein [Halarchaeum rubridurum]|uniref:NOL1/NOP2/fmu family ribosome biogenesis protein n=1 Tax=Halarchaeum rubridurum TaxID=489911 RepID=A0A830G2B2_9EURY|nr:hypothetical protein [Halarchaeum rubridurum]MBP1955350.1 NOL1/NOP2/fmu family ribosome biogenesis protein [Halarchaeum rubridurum]GGM71699.1 hypothetical protein GCM10009017_22040 [Halarchaeum rubridurum]